jgi:fluoride exporter
MSQPAAPVDADPHPTAPAKWKLPSHRALVLLVISAGGVLGALGRYAISAAWPHPPGGFPWSTWAVNVSGCWLIGVVMVLATDVFPRQPLLRPFLCVGVLGGYTTFSTYIADIGQAATTGAAGIALAYLAATLVAAMLTVWAGATTTQWTLGAIRYTGRTQAAR